MFLVKSSLSDVVKHQYQFKLKAYIDLFNSLIVMQLIAIVFSLSGIGQGSRGSFDIDLNINYYTADYVVVFTIIWAFTIAIQITSKDYREQVFPFVTNNLAQHLSNILFLLTASAIGSILAILSRYFFQVIIRFIANYDQIFVTGLTITFTELLMGIIATILYVFLFSALGYFIGMLVQLNKIFIAIIPASFIGILFYFSKVGGFSGDNFIYRLLIFYFQEKVFFLFLLKMILTSALLYGISYFISSRLEVR